MKKESGSRQEQMCKVHRGGRGPSSYWMHDPDIVFGTIQLAQGESFLDLGCGPGDYAIKAAEIVGIKGKVIAVDASPRMIDVLTQEVERESLKNIETMTADITEPMAIGDDRIDVCFLSTVLHIFRLEQVGINLFNEIRRVLKPGGRMAVIECKKEEAPFGPPIEVRLSPDEISAMASRSGFIKKNYVDLGHNYLLHFVADPKPQGTEYPLSLRHRTNRA